MVNRETFNFELKGSMCGDEAQTFASDFLGPKLVVNNSVSIGDLFNFCASVLLCFR